MTTKISSPELDVIFKAVQVSAGNTDGHSHHVTALESVIAECWVIMSPAQRKELQASKLLTNLNGAPTCNAASVEVVALPHHHHNYTYSKDSAEEAMFQSMLVVWYQLADMLRQHPPGTVLQYDGGELVMGEMNGELFMFESMDMSRNIHGWNTFRPQDFNGIGESDWENIRDSLEVWLEHPSFAERINPELVSQAIMNNYADASSRPHWVWDSASSTL